MAEWPQKYMPGDKSHLYQLKPCEGCGLMLWIQKRRRFCSNHCANWGENSPVWKGDDAKYMALHERVYRRRGKAHTCDRCPSINAPGERYEWANLTGNYTDIWDYESMCKYHHDLYDGRLSA